MTALVLLDAVPLWRFLSFEPMPGTSDPIIKYKEGNIRALGMDVDVNGQEQRRNRSTQIKVCEASGLLLHCCHSSTQVWNQFYISYYNYIYFLNLASLSMSSLS